MTTALPPTFHHSQAPRTFGTIAGGMQDKKMRRSSPDSEALASSDEEQEHVQRGSALLANANRRPSWKIETQPRPQRQGSFAGNQLSPASTTQAGDTSWNAALTSPNAVSMGGRGSFSQSYHWGGGGNIWNNEWKEQRPGQELMQSPTSLNSPGLGPTKGELPTKISRESIDGGVPFPIPLQPNPKVYRSQSYSVGQIEQDAANAAAAAGRGRPAQTTLHHRPSRPSLLSEVLHEPLGRVNENMNGEEGYPPGFRGRVGSTSYPKDGNPYPMSFHHQDKQLRNRSSAGGLSASSGFVPNKPGSHRYLSSDPQEPEYAIEETDDLNDLQPLGPRGLYERRYSELGDARFSPTNVPDNRPIDHVKRGHWQSSPAFGDEGHPSRRHSFADVSLRHGSIGSSASIGSIGDQHRQAELGLGLTGRNQRFNDIQRSPNESAYFANIDPAMRPDLPQAQGIHNPNYARHATPPTRGMYAVPPHVNMQQPRQNQLLYIVTFKCCRADVFYIQEGTGLQVKPGDLVIVEADRGTDLGTVAQSEVTWAQAKEWKEFYAHEHYKWLMVFSRQGSQGSSTNLSQNIQSGLSPSGSAVGGMGPGPGMMPEPGSNEIKPKMIKRLAQAHEVQTLREKEGNEAKAKRVCQQKVSEHHLNMEILDAEFQMDWKKLTFYYFADSYINFNSLVTDLFKIYKTRIWMSALNPASFAHPTAGLQPPTGLGPGALGIGRDAPIEYRQTSDQPPYNSLGLVQDPNNFVFPSLNSK